MGSPVRLVFLQAGRQQDDRQAVLSGHPDVQDQHVRLIVLDGLEGFRAIATAGADL